MDKADEYIMNFLDNSDDDWEENPPKIEAQKQKKKKKKGKKDKKISGKTAKKPEISKPYKKPEDIKSENFRCRITKGQLENLEANAERIGMDKNNYFRKMCCEKTNREVNKIRAEEEKSYGGINKTELIKLKLELSRIGNNLNQIARTFNMTEKVKKTFLEENLEGHNKLIKEIEKLIKGE